MLCNNLNGKIIWKIIDTCRHMYIYLTQWCPTLCDPTDCSLPVCSVHGVSQARILEWVAIPFSRGSSWPRDQTQVSCTAGRYFTGWATREAPLHRKQKKKKGKIHFRKKNGKRQLNAKLRRIQEKYLCCRVFLKQFLQEIGRIRAGRGKGWTEM